MGGNKEGSGSRKQERRVNEVREEWERGRRVGEWSRRRQRERERSDVGSGSNAAGERSARKRSLRGGGIGSEGRGRGVEMLGRGRLSQGKQ